MSRITFIALGAWVLWMAALVGFILITSGAIERSELLSGFVVYYSLKFGGLLSIAIASSIAAIRAASFFFGFLAVSIIGVETITRYFETLPSERIGASAFLFLLCFAASAISTLAYLESSRRLHRSTKWLTGLLGGVAAAGAYCASVIAGYAGLGFGYAVALTLMLPILTGLLWPFLCARAPALPNSN